MSGPGRHRLVLASLIAAATVCAYLPILDNGFVNFDDDEYVTDQPLVRQGFSARAAAESFRATAAANWHPVTWMAHMLDVSVWGMNPRGHHATSLLLHVLNAILLFLFFEERTRAWGRSALVAALFALHPLHVESVAWVAERKDLLCALFWILTLTAWARWVDRPSSARYVAALAFFGAGLMSKPMIVTLPLTLLLMDLWPLRRLDRQRPLASMLGLVREKVPYVALAAAGGALTVWAQRTGGSWGTLEQYPLNARVANALVAVAAYLKDVFWPARLAVFYPHDGGSIPWWEVVGSAAVFGFITVWVHRVGRKAPAVRIGWWWYLVTLLPVLGLIQVGEQARADRYTYVPLIGVFVALAWGLQPSRDSHSPSKRAAVARAVAWMAALAVLAACGAATWRQAKLWRDSETLFAHALAVTDGNYVAHINLALALSAKGEAGAAANHYERALAIRPDSATAHNNLGRLLAGEAKLDAAIEQYRAALAFDPAMAEAHGNLGRALALQGRLPEGIASLSTAVRLQPESAPLHYNLGTALAAAGRGAEAEAEFRAALSIDPAFGLAHSSLAGSLYLRGDFSGAWREVRAARDNGSEPVPALIERLKQALPEPR